MEIIKFIENIPAAFWGVMFGSILSLGGVLISNRANAKRLEEQLKHDRESKRKERELALRKEIYLDAAEALATGVTTITRYANLSIPFDKINSDYSEKSTTLVKVQVIANQEAAAAIANATSELTAAHLRLSIKRIPLSSQKDRLDNMKRQIVEFETVRNQMIELMRQHNINNENNQNKFAVLQQNFDFESKRIKEYYDNHQALSKDLFADHLAFVKECMDETSNINRILIPTITAMKRELELPIDISGYKAIIEENISKQEKIFAEFVSEIQPMMEDPAAIFKK